MSLSLIVVISRPSREYLIPMPEKKQILPTDGGIPIISPDTRRETRGSHTAIPMIQVCSSNHALPRRNETAPTPCTCCPVRLRAQRKPLCMFELLVAALTHCSHHVVNSFAAVTRICQRFQGAGFSLTMDLILRSYAARSFLNRLYASAWAGDSGLGSFSKSWMPRRICLMVIAGFQPSSSFNIDRQTVPDGYTFG